MAWRAPMRPRPEIAILRRRIWGAIVRVGRDRRRVIGYGEPLLSKNMEG